MGNYFRAGGYDTYYKGKWHISEEDIHIPGTYNALLSFNDKGEPDPKTEQEYLNADRLGPYGFSGWIGPEPHGSNPHSSGSSAATVSSTLSARALWMRLTPNRRTSEGSPVSMRT